MWPVRTMAVCAILIVSVAKAADATTTTTTTTTTVTRLEPTTNLDLGVTLPALTDQGANTQIFVDLMKVLIATINLFRVMRVRSFVSLLRG